MKNFYQIISHCGTNNQFTSLFQLTIKRLFILLFMISLVSFIPNAMYADAGSAGHFIGCTGPPPQPGAITGIQTPCYGSVQTYTIANVTGATSYSWSLPIGWQGTSTTTSITVTVMNSSTFITVSAINSCGSSPAESLAVTVGHVPAEPGQIIGSNSVCAGTVQTYTIAPVTGASYYTWSLPNGTWSGTSATTSITVTIGTGGGNVIVHANNACGASPGRTLAVTVISAPNAPAVINGPIVVCQGSTVTYTITSIQNATSYVWTLPSGWTGSSTSNSITTTVGTTGGTITVYAVNACGNSTAITLTVSVINTVPGQPGPINGNAAPCDSSSQTYFVVPVVGATSYIWTTPLGWTGTSTTNSIVANVMNISGTISVKAVNACGIGPARTLAVTVGMNSLSQPGPITGPTSVCAGSVQTYTIAPVTGASSYTWTIPIGWSGTSTTTSITVTVGTTSGTITVRANNSCGSSLAQGIQIQVITAPQQGLITGSTSPCSGTGHTYSITSVLGGTYVWSLPSGWTGTSITNSIQTTPSTTSGYVKVYVSNACGSVTDSILVTIATIPAEPVSINGLNPACLGSIQTYTISPVTGATSYNWSIPGTWTGTSTTTSIVVTVGSTGGAITVSASNGCGTSPIRTLQVTVQSQGTLGVISGTTSACQGSSLTFTVAPITGATSYVWTLPTGWSGTSSTTSITVTLGANSGNISVFANTACGTSNTQTLMITVLQVPAEPGPINGPQQVCAGSVNTYTIAPVTGATSYTWTLPNGWTGSSTSTSITLTVGSSSGNITVTANNACGSSAPRILAITVNTVPPQPGPINGNITICSGSVDTFSISPVSGASSYIWTLPNGWSGTSTTTSISTTAGANSGNVIVMAHNSCGSSPGDTLHVVVNTAVPAQPGPIYGVDTLCHNSGLQTYTITPVTGANSYIWTVPAGWSGSSTTNSIIVTVGLNPGNITVKAINACGASSAQTLSLSFYNITVTISGNPGNYNFCAQVNPTSVIMTASGGYSSYAWTPSGGNTQTATVSSVNTFTVTATNGAGCTTTATRSVTNNCALPTNLYITLDTMGHAQANWTPSQCVVNYTIRICIHNTNNWTSYTTSNVNYYTFQGLTQNTSYDWEIQTNCTSNGNINSGWSAIQTFVSLSPRMAETGNETVPFTIYPNPANDEATISFATMEEGTYTIKLIDMLGRELKSEVLKAVNGDNAHILNLNGMAKGVYTIILQKGENISKGKLIVE